MNAITITPTHITLEFLEKAKACTDQVEIFKKTFPEGAEITLENLMVAAEHHLDLNWLANKILDAPAWKVYEKTRAPAWKVYEETRAPAWKVYEETLATAWKVYEKTLATAFYAAYCEMVTRGAK
jgi:phage tail protein X